MLQFVFTLLRLQLDVLGSLWKAYWFLAYSFLVSLLVFVMFYTLYLPPAEHSMPVYFTYNPDCEQGLHAAVCTYPQASVQLKDHYKPTNDNDRVLARGQGYTISLLLEMPLSDENKKLGMFLSKIDLLSKKGLVLASSTRSGLFKYESDLLSTISVLFYLIPLLLGLKQEKQFIEVVLFNQYVDVSYEPASIANVTIFSKRIQIYSANLKMKAVFTGLRYYMYEWPITFSVVSFSNILILVTIVFIWRKVHKPLSAYNENKENGSDDEEGYSTDGFVEDIDLLLTADDGNIPHNSLTQNEMAEPDFQERPEGSVLGSNDCLHHRNGAMTE